METSQLELARQQIDFTRGYTRQLLQDTEASEWFRIPDGAVSHLAWQVGHLAMAEYGLTLLRIRGKEPGDAEFIPNDFIRCFQKGTTPLADPGAYPPWKDILAVFDRVHQQAAQEMAGYTMQQLSEPLPAPTAVYENKLGSLLFCPLHEMLHAGQIGTLRRMLGKPPLR